MSWLQELKTMREERDPDPLERIFEEAMDCTLKRLYWETTDEVFLREMVENSIGDFSPEKTLCVPTHMWRAATKLLEKGLIKKVIVTDEEEKVFWLSQGRRVKLWYDHPVRNGLTWWENFYKIQERGYCG